MVMDGGALLGQLRNSCRRAGRFDSYLCRVSDILSDSNTDETQPAQPGRFHSNQLITP